MEYHVLSDEVVLDNPWLKVVKQRIRNAEGVIIEDFYHITTKTNTVLIAALTPDGHIILIWEYRLGCQDYVWQLPGGHVEDGETALEAAKRELLAETGYEAKEYKLLASWYHSPARMPDKEFIFLATGAQKVQPPEHEEAEDIVVKSVPLSEAVNMAMANAVKDPSTVGAILRLEKEHKGKC